MGKSKATAKLLLEETMQVYHLFASGTGSRYGDPFPIERFTERRLKTISKKMAVFFNLLHKKWGRNSSESKNWYPCHLSMCQFGRFVHEILSHKRSDDPAFLGHQLAGHLYYCSDRWHYGRVMQCEWLWQQFFLLITRKLGYDTNKWTKYICDEWDGTLEGK